MCSACDAKFGEFYRSTLCYKAQQKFQQRKDYPKDLIRYQIFRIPSDRDGVDSEVVTIINDLYKENNSFFLWKV